MGPNDAADSKLEHPMRELEPSVLGEIVGLLTHDIRNPLAALSSNVGYLTMVGQTLPQDVREAIFDLQLSVEVMSRISDTMEVMSQELRGLEGPTSSNVVVSSLLQALRPQAERAAASHGVNLSFESSADLRVRVAEPAFSRALANMLHNSISLAPAGSTVRLLVSQTPSGVSFCVEDQGSALGVELLEQAFTPAGQLEVKSRAEGRYTRGMGLYMVGRCATLAGATVRVPKRDRGSAIELLAPVAS